MTNANHGPKFGQKVEIVTDARGTSLKIFGARTMYANVNKPRPSTSEKEGGYDCEFAIPKEAPGVKEAVAFICAQAKLHFPGATPKLAIMQLPDIEIRNLTEQGLDVPEHLKSKAGMVVFKGNSSSKVPPSVSGNIYSGCYAGAMIGVAKYDAKDKKSGQRFFGIKGYLNIVQFQGDGEPFSGRVVNVEDVFGVATPESTQVVESDPQAEQHDDFTAGMPGYGAAPSKPQGEDDLPFN